MQKSAVFLANLLDHSCVTYPQILRNVRVEDREVRRNWQQWEPLRRAIVKAETAMAEKGRVFVRASGT